MKATRKQHASIARMAIAATATLLASGFAAAESEPQIPMTCEFPLVGNQEVFARFNTSLPEAARVGEPTGSSLFAANIDIPADFIMVLHLLGVQNLYGTIEPELALYFESNSYLPLNPDMAIPPTEIPALGALAVGASADLPSLTLSEPQSLDLTITELAISFRTEKADGSSPDPTVAQFRTPCSFSQPYTVRTIKVGAPLPGEENLKVSEESVAFGPIGLGFEVEETIDVRNESSLETYAIESIELIPANSAFTTTDDCSYLTPPYDSCSINVRYAPVTAGKSEAEIRVQAVDEQGQRHVRTVALSGTGLLALPIAAVTGSGEFSPTEVGKTSFIDLTVTNRGQVLLEIARTRVEGPEFSIQSTTCGPLLPAESCSFRLAFQPVSAGEATGAFYLTAKDGSYTELVTSLAGTGLKAQPPEPDPVLEFDTVKGEALVGPSEAIMELSGFTSDGIYRQGDGRVDLGMNMTLAPTSVTLPVQGTFRTYQATLQIEFNTLVPFEGWVFLEGQYEVSVPRITVPFFGQDLLIGGGKNCQTSAPVKVSLFGDGNSSFDLREGGRLKAEFDLPELENCGLFTQAINRSFVSTGNVMMLEFSNAN